MIKKHDINYNKIILSLTLLLPFFDIYRAIIGNKFEIFGVSIVEIINFVFTSLLFLLLFIKCKKEGRRLLNKKIIFLIFIYLVYIILHITHVMNLKDVLYLNYSSSIFVEIYFIVRSYILPLLLLYIYMKSNLKAKDIIDILSKFSLIISVIIVVTNLLGTSLIAYSSDYEGLVQIKGNIFSWFNGIDYNSVDLYTSRGLFYSTNQISAILGALLFVSAFYTLYKNKIIYYISFFIKIIAAIMLSTKTAFLAIVCSILAIFIYAIIKYVITKERVLNKKSMLFVLYLIIMFIIFQFSPIKIKLEGYVDNLNNDNIIDFNDAKMCLSDSTLEYEKMHNLSIDDILNKNELNDYEKNYLDKYITDCNEEFDIPKLYIEFYPIKANALFWNKMLTEPVSTLTNYRTFKNLIYKDFIEKDNNDLDKWLGIGYISNFPYMEIDFVGQNVWFGYIGILLFLLPFILLLLFEYFILLFNLKQKLNEFSVALILSTTFMIFSSFFAGHVFGIFISSTVLSLLLTGLYNDLFKEKLKDNKITFLLLHLGYGGIETATINIANSLCDKYEVELISFYKLNKNQVNKIDKKISVNYLYNSSPNKDEFIDSVRNKKIFKIIKEGIKSVDILLKKKYLVIKSIIQCDSKYVVSTRWDFSILLSRFGNKNAIKIAQEHHYHNNDKKYLNVLKNKYKNINYLFALTKTLESDYKKILKKNKYTKVVLVPNMLYEIPSKTSDLKNKNIITVSRLDYGKKNDDIIRAFSKIKDKSVKLFIIGDGNEYNNLLKLVDELNLKDRVILTGYKNKQEIEEYMLKSSIFLMASLTEGLPMVLLEAMGYGIPCIAYETSSGVLDIINNNKNGYVVRDRNEKEYIEKIEYLINDINVRKEFGKNARKTIDKFSRKEIVKIWESILK